MDIYGCAPRVSRNPPMLSNARLPFEKIHRWFMAVACSINLAFGAFALFNSLDIRFYHFYAKETISIVIFSPYLDWLVWLVSATLMVAAMAGRVLLGPRERRVPAWTVLPGVLLAACLAFFSYGNPAGAIASSLLGFAAVAIPVYYGEGSFFTSRSDALALVLACSGALLIAIEAASLCSWLINPFDYQFPFDATPRWVFPTADLNIFSALYPLTPFLLLALLLCWVWMPLRGRLLARLGRWGAILAAEVPPAREVSARAQAVVVSISAALAGFVAYYPYIRLSTEYLVGRDGVNYYGFLTRMTDAWSFTTVFPDRPLFMLFLYAVRGATQQPTEIVLRFMPVLCAVALVLSVFWLVKTGTKDSRLALLSSIFAAFSFQVTAGMMGYFLAGWLALVGIMLFFTLLLKAQERRLIMHSSLAGLVSIAVLGTHPYHWLIMMAVLAFYALITVAVRRCLKRELLVLAAPLAITAAAALPLLLFTGLGPLGLSKVTNVLNSLWQALAPTLTLSKITLLTASLSRTVDFWLGGAFGSPLIYILSILGIASMADLRNSFNRLLFCWVLVPLLAIFALIPGTETYYSRIFYTIPFQIPAAIGFSWLLMKLGSALTHAETKPARVTYPQLLQMVLFSLLFLLLFNYALRIVDQVVILHI